MDKEGLLNPQGLWNWRGAALAGLFALAVLVGFHYLFFEQILAALGIFSILWASLVAAAFMLALAERASELAVARLAGGLVSLPRVAWRLLVRTALPELRQPVPKSSTAWKAVRIAEKHGSLVGVADSHLRHHRRAA